MSVGAFYRLPLAEQSLWLARHEREALRCPHCGNPREECSDPKKVWYPQRAVCYATMEAAGANTLYARLHEVESYHSGDFTDWAKVASRDHPFHHSAGVTIWAAGSDLTPDDGFLGASVDDDGD